MSRGHYFDPDPSVAASEIPTHVELHLPDVSLRLRTDRGVFSAERIDPGTRYLLSECRPQGTTLVDLGCGYGPIACTLARRSPDSVVWAVDINQRARQLCRSNAAEAGLSNIRVVAPHEVPSDLVVDELWSNPPIRIGKAALHDLLTTWLGRLRHGGRAVVVVQRHLGADSLARWIEDQGWTVERLGSRQGYRLLALAGGTERAGSSPPADRPEDADDRDGEGPEGGGP